MSNLKDSISDSIDWAISEVISEYRRELGIPSNDIPSDERFALVQEQESLAWMIAGILERQRDRTAERSKVGERVYITGVTLLSTDEVEENKGIIPEANKLWWSRSRGKDGINSASCVGGDGSFIFNKDVSALASVRPALCCNLEFFNIKPGDKVVLKGQAYTALRGNYLLKDEYVGECCFRKKRKAVSDRYEALDVKKFVEQWY